MIRPASKRGSNVHQIILLPPADMITPSHQPKRVKISDYGHQHGTHTEAIDPQVVPVVLPQDLNLTGPLAQGKAVQEQQKLDA